MPAPPTSQSACHKVFTTRKRAPIDGCHEHKRFAESHLGGLPHVGSRETQQIPQRHRTTQPLEPFDRANILLDLLYNKFMSNERALRPACSCRREELPCYVEFRTPPLQTAERTGASPRSYFCCRFLFVEARCWILILQSLPSDRIDTDSKILRKRSSNNRDQTLEGRSLQPLAEKHSNYRKDWYGCT